MPQHYRFLACSCKSVGPAPWKDGNQYYGYMVDDELDLSEVTFNTPLSAKGGFSAKLPNDAPTTFPYPPRDILIIERNGTPVWAGIPWAMSASSEDPQVQCGGDSAWGFYADHQEYRRTQKWSQQAIEQNELVYRIARQAAEDAPGGLLTLWQWEDTGKTYTLPDSSETQPQKVGGIIEQIATAAEGFDFAIVPYRVGDTYLLWWEIYYPKWTRNPAAQSSLVLAYEGAISKYTWQHDGGRMSNDWRETGQAPPGGPSAGASTPYADAWDQGSIDTYLHLQGSGSLQSSDQSLLQGTADQEIHDRRNPIVVSDITLKPGRSDTEFTQFFPGQYINIVIHDKRVQVDQGFQIGDIKVDLVDTGDWREKEEIVTLTAVAPT